MTRREAFKMAMDIDGHMNDNPHGIDLSWDSIEKLVNEAYAKGAAEEREACAQVCESLNEDFDHLYVSACADVIRARGQG